MAAFTGRPPVRPGLPGRRGARATGHAAAHVPAKTSVLERLSGPLCNAVTGREGSQALLEQAERAGLFLVPLDEVRGWWRYHHLFADLLRARLQEKQPGRIGQLHRNAAAWYAGHGLADDAISHAAAAGEMLWAARIIEQHFNLVYNVRGEAATIHRWLSVLPAEVVRSRPRLLLAQAIMAATGGHLEVVEPLLDAVECAPPGWADEPFEPTAGVTASFLINVAALITLHRGYLAQFRDDAGATAVFAAQALAESKPEERLLSATAHGFLAVAEWLRGRLAEAECAFVSSVTGWREAGHLTTTAWRWYELVLVRRAQGRLDAAVLTPGSCWPRTARRWPCWTGCAPRRSPRTEPPASSRSVRCERWPSRPDGEGRWRSPCWPRRCCWPVRRAMCGSSPTRARRWPCCSAG